MWHAHTEADQIARSCLRLGIAEHEIELPLQHIKIFILVGMNMRRHERARWQRRVPGEAVLGIALRHIGLAEDVPGNALDPLIGPRDAGDFALH